MSDFLQDLQSLTQEQLSEELHDQLADEEGADEVACQQLVAAGAKLTPEEVYELGNAVAESEDPLEELAALTRCVPVRMLFAWEPAWLRDAPFEVVAAALGQLNSLDMSLSGVVGPEGLARALHMFLEYDKLDCCQLVLDNNQGLLPYTEHQTDEVVRGLRIAMGFMSDGDGLVEEEGDAVQARLHWFLCGTGEELRPELRPFMPAALLARVATDSDMGEDDDVDDVYEDDDFNTMSPLMLAGHFTSPMFPVRKLVQVCAPFCGVELLPALTWCLARAETEDAEDMAETLRGLLAGGGHAAA
jgi:hypothetical protein